MAIFLLCARPKIERKKSRAKGTDEQRQQLEAKARTFRATLAERMESAGFDNFVVVDAKRLLLPFGVFSLVADFSQAEVYKMLINSIEQVEKFSDIEIVEFDEETLKKNIVCDHQTRAILSTRLFGSRSLIPATENVRWEEHLEQIDQTVENPTEFSDKHGENFPEF